MSKNYYQDLGVEKGATQDEIKKAYRRLAHQHHPDKNGGDEAKFKEVNEAFQVLGDDKKRAQYDQFGSAAFENGGSPFGGSSPFGAGGFNPSGFNVNMGDMGDLGDILGGMFGFGSHNTKQRRGQDIQMDVELDFLEMVKGVTKKIRLYKHDKCTKCKGIGAEEGSKINTCQECGGQGRVQKAQRTIFGTVQSLATCAKCYGKGEVPEKSCSQCKGNGIEKIDKEIDVPIPAGISDTEGVRITGEGENPGREGKSGDLFLRIRVKQHPIFTREVNDILSTVEVPYSMLSLGGKIDVETVDGQGSLKIPSSTKPGTVFKLRGKGIPFMRSLGRGDHLITVQTKVEKNLSREQKKMIEQLRDSGL